MDAGQALVDRTTGKPMETAQLFQDDGKTLRDLPQLFTKEKHTGLLVPKRGTRVIGADGKPTELLDKGMCIHPRTGKVVPIAGHTAIDVATGKIVFTTGPDAFNVENTVPFIPYPIDATGEPVDSKLRMLAGKIKITKDGFFTDPYSGLRVPIVAASFDPANGKVLPVGGAMEDPLTHLPTAIELEKLMIDRSTGQPVPVTGIDIDVATGKAIPVGGAGFDPSGKKGKAIAIDTKMRDPMTGRPMTAGGSRLTAGGVMPTTGQYVTATDALEVENEAKFVRSLDEMQQQLTQLASEAQSVYDIATKSEGGVSNPQVQERLADLRRRAEDVLANRDQAINQRAVALQKSREQNKRLRIQHLHRLREIRREVNETAETGGVSGTMIDPISQKEVPIVIGGQMVDPVTGELVPIIGTALDKFNRVVPLVV